VKEINESLQNARVIIEPGGNEYYFYLTGKNINPDKFLQLLKQEIGKAK
jgi:hypothetical protein